VAFGRKLEVNCVVLYQYSLAHQLTFVPSHCGSGTVFSHFPFWLSLWKTWLLLPLKLVKTLCQLHRMMLCCITRSIDRLCFMMMSWNAKILGTNLRTPHTGEKPPGCMWMRAMASNGNNLLIKWAESFYKRLISVYFLSDRRQSAQSSLRPEKPSVQPWCDADKSVFTHNYLTSDTQLQVDFSQVSSSWSVRLIYFSLMTENTTEIVPLVGISRFPGLFGSCAD